MLFEILFYFLKYMCAYVWICVQEWYSAYGGQEVSVPLELGLHVVVSGLTCHLETEPHSLARAVCVLNTPKSPLQPLNKNYNRSGQVACS